MTFDADGKANVKATALAWLDTIDGQFHLDDIKERAYDDGYRSGVDDANGQGEWDSGYEQGYDEGYEAGMKDSAT